LNTRVYRGKLNTSTKRVYKIMNRNDYKFEWNAKWLRQAKEIFNVSIQSRRTNGMVLAGENYYVAIFNWTPQYLPNQTHI
jgi:hypothetical protein